MGATVSPTLPCFVINPVSSVRSPPLRRPAGSSEWPMLIVSIPSGWPGRRPEQGLGRPDCAPAARRSRAGKRWAEPPGAGWRRCCPAIQIRPAGGTSSGGGRRTCRRGHPSVRSWRFTRSTPMTASEASTKITSSANSGRSSAASRSFGQVHVASQHQVPRLYAMRRGWRPLIRALG